MRATWAAPHQNEGKRILTRSIGSDHVSRRAIGFGTNSTAIGHFGPGIDKSWTELDTKFGPAFTGFGTI